MYTTLEGETDDKVLTTLGPHLQGGPNRPRPPFRETPVNFTLCSKFPVISSTLWAGTTEPDGPFQYPP